MYNVEIKEEYLNTTSPSIQYILRNMFNKVESYEILYQKDIFDFIEEEIITFMISLNSSSLNTLNSYASVLRGYTQWSITKNLNVDSINHFDGITTEVLQKNCINLILDNTKYISRKDLLYVIDNDIVNTEDKFLVLALFEGICGEDYEEINNVTEKQLNEDGTITLCTGRTIAISNELRSLIIKSCNEYEYLLPAGGQLSSLPLLDTNVAFKPRANVTVTTPERAKLRIINRLNKLRIDTGCISLSIDRLRNSGVLDSVKLAAQTDNIDKEKIFKSAQMKDIQIKYEIQNQFDYQLKAKFKAYV